MSTVTATTAIDEDPARDAQRHHSACRTVGELALQSRIGMDGPGESWWLVKIHVDHDTVHRTVECDESETPGRPVGYRPWQGDGRWRPELEIWPSWHQLAAELGAGEPKALIAADERSRTNGERLRDSAKWMATVIGVSLAALVGTSPLVNMRDRGLLSWVMGGLGLGLLAATLVLILNVLRPKTIAFGEIQNSVQGPLRKWREMIEEEQDLYLPCGVRCLTTLRQAMLVDELTLNALALAINKTQSEADTCSLLTKALKGRMARLSELRATAAHIVTVADFYQLQLRSRQAAWVGTFLGVTGSALIIAAFASPT